MRSLLLAVVPAAALMIAGCTSDAASKPHIGTADAYVSIVAWQLGEQGPPSTDGKLPVVYVTASNGKSIDAGVQAKVAKQTVDDAKVRFADTVEDATETDTDGAPVRDEGVLLIVDPIDADGEAQMQLPVTVYRSDNDQSRYRLSLQAIESGVSVKAATPIPID